MTLFSKAEVIQFFILFLFIPSALILNLPAVAKAMADCAGRSLDEGWLKDQSALFFNRFRMSAKTIFVLIFILFSSEFLHASRWPWVMAPNNTEKNFLVSPKKRTVIRSRTSFKHAVVCDRMHHVFPSVSSFKKALEEINVTSNVLESVFANARKKRSKMVRVLLSQVDNQMPTEWRFASPQGFMVQLGEDTKKTIKVPALVIKTKRGVLFYNGKRVKSTLRLRPVCGHGECNGTTYDGEFYVMVHKDKFLCINQLDLEDYITAVLRTESWPGWPLEVNKVFAIACRSYVMFKALEAKRSGRPYHVKNTNEHQTYRGKHELPLLKAAVEQTRGVVLGFEGKPILAMFDCCCGGIIPAHIDNFDFNKVPYLARTYACTYCKQSSLYSWQVSYEQTVFDALLKQYQQDILRLSDIHVIKKDKAGLVTEVRLRGPKHTTIIPGKKLYSLLKEVKSFHFDVCKKSGKIIFTGRGFGHHIGLCQWGARQMVRDGWDYKSILRFYYPGAYFMHLI